MLHECKAAGPEIPVHIIWSKEDYNLNQRGGGCLWTPLAEEKLSKAVRLSWCEEQESVQNSSLVRSGSKRMHDSVRNWHGLRKLSGTFIWAKAPLAPPGSSSLRAWLSSNAVHERSQQLGGRTRHLSLKAGAMHPSKSVSGARNVRGYTASQKHSHMILLCNNKSVTDEPGCRCLVRVVRLQLFE